MKFLSFAAAALFEIGGCYLIWLGQGRSSPVLQIAGGLCLIAFGYMIASINTGVPSRTYAIYGGIYVAASLLWMTGVDRVNPDRWDIAGIAVTLAGTALIFFGPRG